jgi:hypothetical protein
LWLAHSFDVSNFQVISISRFGYLRSPLPADDPISIAENVRGLVEQMPAARLFVLPDGGYLLLGHTEEARTEITQFLCRHVAELQNAIEPGEN